MGFLDPIVNFLGGLLAIFYQILPNVGLAIILVTVVINLAIFPLTLKQTRSMKAMQEIQPEIKALQKQYKDDRQKLNEEMVALYKERNVNPASGCLPMLLQIPIWWSLFRLLRSFRTGEEGDPARFLPDESGLAEAIADGETMFLGMDLVISPSEAVGDGIVDAIPYLLLVVFIIVTGYWAQRQLTNRRQTDGQEELSPQARQMQTFTKVMPVLFGVISWTLLAGVDLYIAASQVMRMGAQTLIFRMDENNASRPPEQDEETEQTGGSKKSANGSKEAEPKAPAKPAHPVSQKKRNKRRRK